MRLPLLVILTLSLACAKEPAPPVTDTREAIAVEYVKGAEAVAHAKVGDKAAVVARFGSRESVSVLSRKGSWSEVRVLDGSGWVHSDELSTSGEAAREEDDLTPRFRIRPQQVTNPSAHGELVLEANVNSDGDVLSVKTLENGTGSHELEAKNSVALQSARFYPIVQHGKRTPFVYEYRLHY